MAVLETVVLTDVGVRFCRYGTQCRKLLGFDSPVLSYFISGRLDQLAHFRVGMQVDNADRL